MASAAPLSLKGKLTVTIHKAKDLKNVQLLGKQDPYVILNLGSEQFKSRVCEGGGTDVEWEQSFLFNLTGTEDALHIKINDKEVTLDRPIGRLDIPLSDLVTKALKKQHTFQVYDVSNFSKMAGIISISADFQGTGLPSTQKPTHTTTQTPVQQKPVQQQQVQQQAPIQQPIQQQQVRPQPVYQQPQPQPQAIYQQQPPVQVYQQPPVQPIYQQPTPVVYTQPPVQQAVYGQQPVYVQQPVVYTQPPVVPQVIYGQPAPQVIYGQPAPQVRYM